MRGMTMSASTADGRYAVIRSSPSWPSAAPSASYPQARTSSVSPRLAAASSSTISTRIAFRISQVWREVAGSGMRLTGARGEGQGAMLAPRLLTLALDNYARMRMTTRRFCARPCAGVVRADRLVFAVADDVHLVQRHLMRLIEIALHRFGSGFADALIDRPCRRSNRYALRSRRSCRVGFALSCRDHLVDARPRRFRQALSMRT